MTERWVSLEKKFCETCKCWMSDNKSSVEFHENGKRHKENIQRRLGEIQKKTKMQEKEDKKTNRDLKRIEEAAAAAYTKDREINPDISLQLTMYHEQERSVESTKNDGNSVANDKKNELPKQPKILHREEKINSKKSQSGTIPSYSAKGGWMAKGTKSGGLDLELPPKNVPRHPRLNISLTKKTKLSPQFQKDTLVSHERSAGQLLSSATSSLFSNQTASNTNSSEVVFKKRKIARTNMRQRDEDL